MISIYYLWWSLHTGHCIKQKLINFHSYREMATHMVYTINIRIQNDIQRIPLFNDLTWIVMRMLKGIQCILLLHDPTLDYDLNGVIFDTSNSIEIADPLSMKRKLSVPAIFLNWWCNFHIAKMAWTFGFWFIFINHIFKSIKCFPAIVFVLRKLIGMIKFRSPNTLSQVPLVWIQI